jgi:type I restriction enzyme M protein
LNPLAIGPSDNYLFEIEPQLDGAIHGETERVSQQLTQRVKELAERYETPLPRLTGQVAEMEAKVNSHVERMGFS